MRGMKVKAKINDEYHSLRYFIRSLSDTQPTMGIVQQPNASVHMISSISYNHPLNLRSFLTSTVPYTLYTASMRANATAVTPPADDMESIAKL